MGSWWNVISLLMGLVACGSPIYGLTKSKTLKTSTLLYLVFLSCMACGLAILGQLGWQTHLVAIQDYSAMEDTSVFSFHTAIFLCLLIFLFNFYLLFKVSKNLA